MARREELRPARRARRAILHIGAPKTGSTAIQNHCARSRKALLDAGALYPASLGRAAHQPFAAAMRPLWSGGGLRRSFGIGDARAVLRLRRDLAAALAREMAETRPETLIVSCENLFVDTRRRLDAARIRRFLLRFAERVEIVVYLRRQDRAMRSAWLHALRIGKSGDFVPPARVRRGSRYDYAARLAIWRSVFGAGAITPIAFDEATRDAASDFLGRIRLSAPPDDARPNQSLDQVRAAFMAAINAQLPRFAKDGRNPDRGDLDYAIDSAPALGPPAPLPARDARAILALFAASNARLAEDWNNGAPFFDDRIDDGDETATPLETDHVVAVAAHLWRRQEKKLIRLRREIARLKKRRDG